MRKSIQTVCVAAGLFVVLVSAAFAQPGKAAINAAVSWAQALDGQASFPYANGVGSCPSGNWCVAFVANAYGHVAASFNAYVLWCLCEQHPGDLNAPRGSLVFFDRTPDNGLQGHVALCTGDGNLIQAGYAKIRTGKIRWESAAGRYLGWAWPPSNWLP